MTDPNVMQVDDPRGDRTPEWEVFLRDDAGEPLRHVGSVSAPTASAAYEHAASLFGWTADTVWLCPAAEVARFTDRDLGVEADSGAESAPAGAAEVTGAADDGTRGEDP